MLLVHAKYATIFSKEELLCRICS